MVIKTALELLAEARDSNPLQLALNNYTMWYDANQALSLNKEHEISNGQSSKRKITRADATEVKNNLDYWENEISKIQGVSLDAPRITELFTVRNPSL